MSESAAQTEQTLIDKYEQRMAHERQRFRLLLDCSHALSAHLELRGLFTELSKYLREFLHHELTALALYDAESNLFQVYAIDFPTGKGSLFESITIPIDGTPEGRALLSKKPVLRQRVDFAEFSPEMTQVIIQEGLKSGCVVPLLVQERAIGTLTVASAKEAAFTEDDAELLVQIAVQVAIAVENARTSELANSYRDKLASERDRVRLLLEINNAVSSTLSMQDLFREVSNCLGPIFQHDGAAMGIYSVERNELRAYALDAPEGFKIDPEGTVWPIDGTPIGLAVSTREVVIVTEPDRKRFTSALAHRTFDQGINSGCAVPLLRGDRVLGVLAILSRRLRAFTPEKAELLRQICSQIAIAFENSLNFEKARRAQMQMERERDRSQLLLEVNNAVVSHLDLRDLVKSISASLRRIIPHDAAFLTLFEGSQRAQLRVQALDLRLSDKTPFTEGVVLSVDDTPEGFAIQSGRPTVVRTVDLPTFASEWVQHAAANGVRSGCAVPLVFNGNSLGALSVVSSREDAFTEQDGELLQHCSSQIAIAVENARNFNEIAELRNRLAEEKLYLEDEIRNEYFDEIIGDSASLNAVLEQVQTVAETAATVLILGETGSGKELIARAIHNRSPRKARTFVKLNCSAIPTGLLESELFGHEKGAFTGAIAQRIGRLELADKGTLFLDEIGDIPLELQPKLLRALQESEFERLGSSRTQKVDVRLIAATNRDLPTMVASREFRSDLFYRLNVFPVTVPPLRERTGDIPRLVRHFVSKYAQRMNRNIETIPAATMRSLEDWHWPGNVRELENFIERAVILTKGSVLNAPIVALKTSSTGPVSPVTLVDTEREHILKVLRETRGVLSGPTGAADRLGLKRSTLQGKMKKLGISRKDWFQD